MSEQARNEDGAASADHPAASLHEDVISVILSKLDVAERARASRVCQRWRAAALQPPFSTALTLHVLLEDEERQETDHEREHERERRRLDAAERVRAYERGHPRPPSDLRAVLLDEAPVVLGGPLCRGLQELSLVFLLSAAAEISETLSAIGAALPRTLLTLSVNAYGPAAPLSPLPSAEFVRTVLSLLDLQRSAPSLETIDVVGSLRARSPLDLFVLGPTLSHPSIKRLGCSVRAHAFSAETLRKLPRLEVVDSISIRGVDEASAAGLSHLLQARIEAKTVFVHGSFKDGAPARLLRPGSRLVLFRCTLPAAEDWTVRLPAGLADFRLIQCECTPDFVELLLHGTSSCAPGLGKLDIDGSTLTKACDPLDFISALERVAGGTQIAVNWPDSPQGRWSDPDVLARLARAVAAGPTLARCVHVGLPDRALRSLPPAAAGDFAAYRRARAAALRGMGEAGRRLLTAQKYDGESS